MRIACPSCGVTYEVPETRLRPGRSVRCARCHREWVPETTPATPPDWTEPDEEQQIPRPRVAHTYADQPSAMDILASAPPPQARNNRLRAAWLASGIIVIALLGAALVWRQSVMLTWPASERLYALAGLHPAGPAAAPKISPNR